MSFAFVLFSSYILKNAYPITFPISVPTEALRMPPKPTNTPAERALKNREELVYLVKVAPKSSSWFHVLINTKLILYINKYYTSI